MEYKYIWKIYELLKRVYFSSRVSYLVYVATFLSSLVYPAEEIYALPPFRLPEQKETCSLLTRTAAG
jgi:hypothetical protein